MYSAWIICFLIMEPIYFRRLLPLGFFYGKAFIIPLPSTVQNCIEQWNCLACGYVYTSQTHSGLVYTAGYGATQRYHISAEIAYGFLLQNEHSLDHILEELKYPPYRKTLGCQNCWDVKTHSCVLKRSSTVWSIPRHVDHFSAAGLL